MNSTPVQGPYDEYSNAAIIPDRYRLLLGMSWPPRLLLASNHAKPAIEHLLYPHIPPIRSLLRRVHVGRFYPRLHIPSDIMGHLIRFLHKQNEQIQDRHCVWPLIFCLAVNRMLRQKGRS